MVNQLYWQICISVAGFVLGWMGITSNFTFKPEDKFQKYIAMVAWLMFWVGVCLKWIW